MSHLSFLGCEPARCGNWAARRLEFKRTVGVPHGVRKRRGNNTESFTAIKGLAAGRPVLLHVGVVGVISVSKNSGKLYAKVRA